MVRLLHVSSENKINSILVPQLLVVSYGFLRQTCGSHFLTWQDPTSLQILQRLTLQLVKPVLNLASAMTSSPILAEAC